MDHSSKCSNHSRSPISRSNYTPTEINANVEETQGGFPLYILAMAEAWRKACEAEGYSWRQDGFDRGERTSAWFLYQKE